ncbi:hypothetical protein GCM10027343_19750 [Noviherbaspirillum agri]
MVIAVFAAILLDRLSFYQEAAEKAKVEYTISLLKSALRIRMATMMTQGRASSYASLERQNPLDWLEDRQPAYTSVAADFESAEKFSGTWQFDPAERVLSYWPVRSDYLQPDSSGQKRIRLKVVVVHGSLDSSPATDSPAHPGPVPVVSVRLEVESYRWLQ